MPKKRYKKWEINDLTDAIIIHSKVGLEASPSSVKAACRKIANLSPSGITKRAVRIAKRLKWFSKK